jgi:hypothetical protein
LSDATTSGRDIDTFIKQSEKDRADNNIQVQNPNQQVSETQSVNQPRATPIIRDALPGTQDPDTTIRPEDDEETKKNKIYIQKVQTAWTRYYSELSEEKKEWLKLLAPKERHIVYFMDGTEKEFERKRIGTKYYREWEKDRAKLQKEQDPDNATDLLMGLYEKIAFQGLGVTKEEYAETVWEDAMNKPGIKTVCDAINHRATLGGAFFQRKS